MKGRGCPTGRPAAARTNGKQALGYGDWNVIGATTFAPTRWAR